MRSTSFARSFLAYHRNPVNVAAQSRSVKTGLTVKPTNPPGPQLTVSLPIRIQKAVDPADGRRGLGIKPS